MIETDINLAFPFDLTGRADFDIETKLNQGVTIGHILDARKELGWQAFELVPKRAADTGSGRNVVELIERGEIDLNRHNQVLEVIEPEGVSPLVQVISGKIVVAAVVKGHGWAVFKKQGSEKWTGTELSTLSSADATRTIHFRTGDCFGFTAANDGPLFLRHVVRGYNGADENELFDGSFASYLIVCAAVRVGSKARAA